MNAEQIFKKYYAKLVVEGVLRALLFALAVGFTCSFISLFVCWLVGFIGINAFLVSMGVLLVVAALMTVLLYFLFFKPTTVKIARRLDKELSLEERVITMVELRNVQSYMAMVQREDASTKLKEVEKTKLKFPLNKACVIVLAVVVALSGFMLTINILNVNDKSLNSPLVNYWARIPSYYVDYVMSEGGTLEGKQHQVIERGSYTEQVEAVADENYYFVRWNDGYASPVRSDLVGDGDVVYFAYFAPIVDGDLKDGLEDQPDDVPPDEGEGQPGYSDDMAPPGNGTSGVMETNNKIIDGETYYRDYFESVCLEPILELLQSGEELSPELRTFLEAFYKILQ